MYDPKMKSIIKFALELDLVGLEIKAGYSGAPLLTITTYNSEHADKLEKFVKYVAKEINRYIESSENNKRLIKISAVFGEDTVDNTVYQLK